MLSRRRQGQASQALPIHMLRDGENDFAGHLDKVRIVRLLELDRKLLHWSLVVVWSLTVCRRLACGGTAAFTLDFGGLGSLRVRHVDGGLISHRESWWVVMLCLGTV